MRRFRERLSYEYNMFIRSALAGICIGLGGSMFIKLGGIVGAIMFAFGLLTVVCFKLPLYTGQAGFFDYKKILAWTDLVIIWLGNVFGCWLLSLLALKGIDATPIIEARISDTLIGCLLSAIGCGFIMTMVVAAARGDKINYLLILMGIPTFIILGFYHSIADAFYIFEADNSLVESFAIPYLTILVGNFIGCNIPRLFSYDTIVIWK